MTLSEAKRIVRGGEGAFVEFKRKVAHPEKVVKEIVAFANTKGGQLFVGVDDNGNIPGLKFADEDQYVLNKAISDLCRPPNIKFNCEVIPLDDHKSILCYDIKPSRRKPHYALESKEQEFGKAYVRVEDKSIQASREMREILRRSNRKKNLGISIGEKEKQILQCIDNKTLTINEISDLTNISKKLVSRIIVLFVLTNVLEMIPKEGGDLYKLKP